MLYASTATWFTPAKAHPTEAGRKRVRQEVPTYTEEGRKRVRQNMEFPEVRFDDEAAAAAQEVVAKVPSRAACRQEEGRRVIDRSASQMVHSTPAKAHPQRDDRNTEVGHKRGRQQFESLEVRQVRFDDEAAAAAQQVVSWHTLLRPTSVLRSRCGWALAGVL